MHEDTFIGRERRNRRQAPWFLLKVWNIHDRIADGLPKTNNAVEGWHRAFNRLVGADHPSPFNLLAVIRKEQSHTENTHMQMQAGRQTQGSKSKYVQLARRFTALVNGYNQNNKIQFRKGAKVEGR